MIWKDPKKVQNDISLVEQGEGEGAEGEVGRGPIRCGGGQGVKKKRE